MMDIIFDLSRERPGMLPYADRRFQLDENFEIDNGNRILECSVGHEIKCAYEIKNLPTWLTLGVGDTVYDTKFRTQGKVDLTKTPAGQEIRIWQHSGGGLLSLTNIMEDDNLQKEYQEEAIYVLFQSFLAWSKVLVKDFLLVFPP